MTKPDDQVPNFHVLGPTSRSMLALRDVVFLEWERRARAFLAEAKTLAHPILIDTLPAFYDNIAQSLTPEYPRVTGADGATLASEHGGERARVTQYDHETLIREYQLLRAVIYEVLAGHQVPLTRDEILTIDASIDAGIQEAVSAFALVHNGLRERFAAALTHDLRGPLGAASAAMQLILMVNDPAKMKSLAAKALDNMDRMDGMIRELLATMAFHSGERLPLSLTSFDISDILRESMPTVRTWRGAGSSSRPVGQ